MDFDLVCLDAEAEFLNIFSFAIAPSFLFYFYVPVLVLSFVLGYVVLKKDETSLVNTSFFAFTSSYSLFLLNELLHWTLVPASTVHFAWQMAILIHLMIVVSTFLLVRSYLAEKQMTNKVWWGVMLVSAPIIATLPTIHNISTFDIYWCQGWNGFMWYYIYGLEVLLATWILLWGIYKIVKKDFGLKKILFWIATLVFTTSFVITNIWGDLTLFYEINIVGPIGMIIFVITFFYLIVRYHAFNIKMLGAQALVLLLIFSNLAAIFVDNINDIRLIIAITVLLTLIMGYFLVKSVKQVDKQRELLEVANEEQESLIHFISHQVKGFFTKSRNIFDVLAEEKDKLSKDVQPLVDEGLRSDKEGIDMVQSILNAANLKTGKMEYTKTDVELVSMVEKLIGDNKTKAESKGLKINFFHDGVNELIVKADAERIKDVLGNIISNSVNYTFEGGVNVSLEKKDGKAIYKVKDTGVGLTEDDMRKLFRSGGRGKNSLKYNANSTGYGLYIAKKVIEAHNGTISAESEGRDKGSTFTVELPIK